MKRFAEFMHRTAAETKGQDMIEYALILGFISGVMLAILIAAGNSINDILGALNAALNFAIAGL